MAYNGYKGVGPRGLGTSPLKQRSAGSVREKNHEGEIKQFKMPEARAGSGAIGLIGGTAVKAGVGLVKGAINLGKRFFGGSKNAAARARFLKSAPLDPTKTTRLSNYSPKPSSNLRSGSQGGTTSVGSRTNYNNRGSN